MLGFDAVQPVLVGRSWQTLPVFQAGRGEPSRNGRLAAYAFFLILAGSGFAFVVVYANAHQQYVGSSEWFALVGGTATGVSVAAVRYPNVAARQRSSNKVIESNDTLSGNAWAAGVSLGWLVSIAVLLAHSTNPVAVLYVIGWYSATIGLILTYLLLSTAERLRRDRAAASDEHGPRV